MISMGGEEEDSSQSAQIFTEKEGDTSFTKKSFLLHLHRQSKNFLKTGCHNSFRTWENFQEIME